MRFLVERSTDYGQQPCDRAYRVVYDRVDMRNTDDPRKTPFYKDRPEEAVHSWTGEGKNHRLIDPPPGYDYVPSGTRWIARDVPAVGWAVDLDTLEDLLELLRCYGTIEIRKGDAADGTPLLVIKE